MTKDHLKRINAPRTWPIKRKGIKFIVRPDPGAHSMDFGIPIIAVLRDMLPYASNKRDVLNILNFNDILVDSKKYHQLEAKYKDLISNWEN